MAAFKLSDLRALSDEELENRHDDATKNVVVGVAYYLDEVRRRELAAAMAASEKLARRAYWLTVINTVVAVIAVVIAVTTAVVG